MIEKEVNNKAFYKIIMAGFEVVVSVLLYFMLFFSALPRKEYFLQQELFWVFVNCVLVFSFIRVMYSVTGKRWVALLVVSVISFIWSLADYFTVLYHGSPLFLGEFANFKTAMEVAGSYSFAPDSNVIKLIFAFAVLVLFAILTGLIEKKTPVMEKKKKTVNRIGSLAVGIVGIVAVLFVTCGPMEIKPQITMGWSWKAGVKSYGILVCSIEDIQKSYLEPYVLPEGYSAEELSEDVVEMEKPVENMPNVIVILNESFYDIDAFFETKSDVSAFESFYGIDNAVYGFLYAGDGTNSAEYTLLTSNSLYLLNITTPFNYLDMKDQPVNIVNYMKRFGYVTTGMHCGQKENYHRNQAYPDLEFDNIYLGEEDFAYREKNGQRAWLDSDNYKEMLEHLKGDSSRPQFMFLLTYQNHGGYDQNDASLDTVHVGIDYGDNTEQLNEFLSSVKLSCEAFRKLTDDLKDEEPTVVVMVGDHAPLVVSDLMRNEYYPDYSEDLVRGMVPFVVWTNYKEVPEEYGNLSSMEALIPTALELSGLPLSSYYQLILKLQKKVPFRTNKGMYIDNDGNQGSYSTESPYYELLNEYYCMEYNAIADKKGYNEKLFLP